MSSVRCNCGGAAYELPSLPYSEYSEGDYAVDPQLRHFMKLKTGKSSLDKFAERCACKDSECPECVVYRELAFEALYKTLEQLFTPGEVKIIKLRFGLDGESALEPSQIARRVHKRESWISKFLKRALATLRRKQQLKQQLLILARPAGIV